MHVWPVYDIEPSPSVSHCKSHGPKATGVVTKETGGSSLGKHDMRSFKNTLKKQGLIKLSIFSIVQNQESILMIATCRRHLC